MKTNLLCPYTHTECKTTQCLSFELKRVTENCKHKEKCLELIKRRIVSVPHEEVDYISRGVLLKEKCPNCTIAHEGKCILLNKVIISIKENMINGS